MSKANPVAQNYVQAAYEAKFRQQDREEEARSNPDNDGVSMMGEEQWKERRLDHEARQQLRCDGHQGQSTFRAGETLSGPVEDQGIATWAERQVMGQKPEGGE